MPSCAAICVNHFGKNPSLSFHQIPSNKQKEIRQEWLCCIKHEQNEKYLPNNSTLYICSKYFEKYCFERDLQVNKVSNNNTRTSRIRTSTLMSFWCLILTFEHIPYLVLVFLLLMLNRQMPTENFHVLANFRVPKYSLCILSEIVTTSFKIPIFN